MLTEEVVLCDCKFYNYYAARVDKLKTEIGKAAKTSGMLKLKLFETLHAPQQDSTIELQPKKESEYSRSKYKGPINNPKGLEELLSKAIEQIGVEKDKNIAIQTIRNLLDFVEEL